MEEYLSSEDIAEYERLLNQLQDHCDESATTQVWRDHLDQAELNDNLSHSSWPYQYRSTCEDRDLFQVFI